MRDRPVPTTPQPRYPATARASAPAWPQTPAGTRTPAWALTPGFALTAPLLAQTDGTAPPAAGGGTAPAAGGDTTTATTGDPNATGTGAGTGAGPGAGQAPDPFGGMFFWIMIGGLILMWYFILRSQRKEKDKQKQLVESLRKNDRVQTVGGILGTIIEVRDNEVVLKVDENNNTKLRLAKSAVQHRLGEKGGEKPADKNTDKPAEKNNAA